MAKRKTSRLRRWAKRLGVLLAVLLIAALLSPFFFTTAIVRWALAHSAYSRFNPTISKASLGPTGRLTLSDLELFEAGPLSDAPLLSARQVQIWFSWWKVLGSTISSANIDGLMVHARPGRTYPITLLTLSYPPGMDGVSAEAPSASPSSSPASSTPANPFWFDHLHATGTLRVHSFATFKVSERDLPLTFDMGMHGARNDPHRDLSVALGEPATARAAAATQSTTSTAPIRRPLSEVGPAMTASMRMIPLGGGKTQIAIDHGEGWNLAAALQPDLLHRLLPALGNVTDKTDVVIDRVSISGTIDPAATGNGLWFHGQVEAHDVSLSNAHPETLEMDQFSVSAKVETPLSGGSLADATIHDATTGLGTLNFEGFSAGRTQAEWTLDKGQLNVRTLQAAAVDGTLTGNGIINLLDLTQTQGKLTLEHVDAQQLLAFAPGSADQNRLTTRGHISGEMEIKQVPHGLEGSLSLVPGNDLAVAMGALTLAPGPWNPGAGQAHQVEVRLTATEQSHQWLIGIPKLALSAFTIKGEAEALRKLWPAVPTGIKGPLEMTIGQIEGDGSTEANAGESRGVAHLRLADVSLQAPQSKDYPVSVDHLAATATLSLPLSGPPGKLEIPAGNLTAAAAQFGKVQAGTIVLDWTLLQETWNLTQAKLTAFGGQVTGEALYHQNNALLDHARLNLVHLDQHQLLAAMNPEKVDAEGFSSGPLEVWNVLNPKTGRGGPLQFKGNLVADGPGRLMIKDESVEQQLAQGLNQTKLELLPQNFGDIVKDQLKDYRYLEGHVTLETLDDKPVLHLDYRRAPLTEGEPGYGVKQVIGGQEVVVNYPIQLAGVTVRFGNKSVSELLEMVAGWEREILKTELPPAK